MNSVAYKKPASSFPQKIPQEVLKKAAESALVSSFVELNSFPRKHSTSSSSSGSRNHSSSSRSSFSLPSKKPGSHKVVIDVDTKSPGDAANTTTVFIKVTPKNSPAFADALREIKIHEEFLKELTQCKGSQKSFGLKMSPSLGYIPSCFLTQVSEDNCMIFLENLKAQAFQPFSLSSSLLLDFNHALLAVETLARFHSSSYFMRKQMGAKANAGTLEVLRKFPYVKKPIVTESMKTKASQLTAQFFDKIICKIVEGENPSLAFKLRRKFREQSLLYDKMEGMLENEKYENDDFYVACHGDFRTGNLMFKYTGESGTGDPSECRMVDMKSLQWAPIASDLAYFFFTSTSGKMRAEFEEKLLAFYCDSFEEQLKSRYESQGLLMSPQDFDIEDFHRKLESQYRRMLEYGFYRVITALPILMVGNGDTASWALEELGDIIEHRGKTEPLEFDKFVQDCLNCSDLNESVVSIVIQLVKNKIV